MPRADALCAITTTSVSMTDRPPVAPLKPAAVDTLQIAHGSRTVPDHGLMDALPHPSDAGTAGPSSDDEIVPPFILMKMLCTGMTRKQAETLLAGLGGPQE